jgi:hypothetical protein
MRRLLALLPAAALLLLHGCGSNSSCNSQGANLKAAGTCSNVTFVPGTVTITAKTACQTCADTGASCSPQFGSGNTEVFLDTQFQVCDSSCDTSTCSLNPITCTLTVPAGLTTIQYLDASGRLTPVTVSTGSGGATSCAL